MVQTYFLVEVRGEQRENMSAVGGDGKTPPPVVEAALEVLDIGVLWRVLLYHNLPSESVKRKSSPRCVQGVRPVFSIQEGAILRKEVQRHAIQPRTVRIHQCGHQ
jgi:hypothetical protein